MKRQPYLLLNISIKKSPNAVHNWLSLVALYREAADLVLAYDVLERAISTINPEATEGKLSDVWIEYSLLLQKEGQIRKCN